MKPLSRRSVTTGIVAAVTAIPALALPVVARSNPFERIKNHTRELEEAMREAYGVEVETLTFAKTDDMKPTVFVSRIRLRAEDASGNVCDDGKLRAKETQEGAGLAPVLFLA
jgi:hypothetical protein